MINGDVFSKTLSRNDVGETGSNQSGIYVPIGDIEFFAPIDFESKNDSRDINVIDENGNSHRWKLKWYVKPDDRKELHITFCHALMDSLGVTSEDTIYLKKTDAENFLVSFDGENFMSKAESRVDSVAGSSSFRGNTGQGFLKDVEIKNAIERHAMNIVRDHFANEGYAVEDTSANHPYDFLCKMGEGGDIYVEVKGTTTEGVSVNLTSNEVNHFQNHAPNTVLAIVRGIVIRKGEKGVIAEGGELKIIQPWKPENAALSPISFRYQVPE